LLGAIRVSTKNVDFLTLPGLHTVVAVAIGFVGGGLIRLSLLLLQCLSYIINTGIICTGGRSRHVHMDTASFLENITSKPDDCLEAADRPRECDAPATRPGAQATKKPVRTGIFGMGRERIELSTPRLRVSFEG
jgi:hypothetical protein